MSFLEMRLGSMKGLLSIRMSGDWLFAGTSEGLRCYDYNGLLRSEAMPLPTLSVETSISLQDRRDANCVLVDDARHRVIFTCGDDSLRCFDWLTQREIELKPPIDPSKGISIRSMMFSGDRRHLLFRLRITDKDWQKHQGESWLQVWDYEALSAAREADDDFRPVDLGGGPLSRSILDDRR